MCVQRGVSSSQPFHSFLGTTGASEHVLVDHLRFIWRWNTRPRAAHGALQAPAGTRDFVTLPALNVRVARRLQLPAVSFTSIYHRGRRTRPSRPLAVYLAMEHAPESGPRGSAGSTRHTTSWHFRPQRACVHVSIYIFMRDELQNETGCKMIP